jgi:hypothetical protein
MTVKQKPLVHVLTYCAHPTSAYGSLMVFDTIRTGFPSADIEVWDNGSHGDVVPQIKSAAENVGAKFTAMTNRHYSDHLRWVLLERPHPEGVPLVLSDPDVVFWGSVEELDFGSSLMAGRLMPTTERADVVTMARLHPSLLFIPDVHQLRLAAKRIASGSFAWDGIGQHTSWIDGKAHFWDTLSDLYNAVQGECTAFGEAVLNRYDHLFFGTHLVVLAASQAGNSASKQCVESHRLAATGNIAALRGLWRKQMDGPLTDSDTPDQRTADLKGRVLNLQRSMSSWAGKSYPDAELWGSAVQTIKTIRSNHGAPR